MDFTFEPNLARAATIPSRWYTSAEVLEREYTEIFCQSWHLVARAEQLSKPGDYVPAKIGKEPILLVHDKQGVLRAMSNVCRHRAGPLVVSPGNSELLKCAYHGWSYGLDGALKTTPEFQGAENFEIHQCSLPQFKVATWGPLVFAAVNPIMSFEEYLGKIPLEVEHLKLGDMKYLMSKDYFVDANWKVYVDNYLEGYHIPAVHPELLQELDYKQYRTDTYRWYSYQHAPPKSKDGIYAGGEHYGAESGAYYYWLYPNLMLNIYQGTLQTNVVIPMGVDRCRIHFEWFAREAVPKNKINELVHFSDLVQEQDALICKQVFEGLHSSTYSQGRFSVKRENGVHHFHGLISSALISQESSNRQGY